MKAASGIEAILWPSPGVKAMTCYILSGVNTNDVILAGLCANDRFPQKLSR